MRNRPGVHFQRGISIFLNDLRAAGEYHQPDHWIGLIIGSEKLITHYRYTYGRRRGVLSMLTNIRPAEETYRLHKRMKPNLTR